MACAAINWGDVPTWVGAITTTLAFIAAAIVVYIELRRDKRAAQDKARGEQAALVATWPGYLNSAFTTIVRNGSNLPIYNVEIAFHRNDKSGWLLSKDTRDILPPGDHSWPFPDRVGPRPDSPPFDPYEWSASVTFTDAAGRRWFRGPQGTLEQKIDDDD